MPWQATGYKTHWWELKGNKVEASEWIDEFLRVCENYSANQVLDNYEEFTRRVIDIVMKMKAAGEI